MIHTYTKSPLWNLNNPHYKTYQLFLGRNHWIKRMILKRCFEAIQVTIKVNMDPLESLYMLPYLGHTIVCNISDWVALYKNLRKSQRHWGVV